VQELTDDDLMIMFREGDADAFDVLFDRHHASVYNFARIMLRDADRAQDVLQETFLAVVGAAARYRPQKRFRSWLLRMCRNRCLNVLAAERTRRLAVSENGFELIVMSGARRSAREEVDARERVALVRRAIEDLPERQREAITLFAFEGMRYRDISDVLDLPVNTVKTMIHRSRAALAQAVEKAQRCSDAV